MRSAIFFERDGILTAPRVEKYAQVTPLTLEAFQVNTAAIEPLRRLKSDGFLLIATTNQPEVSRGTLSRRELDRMHVVLQRTFNLDAVVICPHEQSDNCPCRKPKPGLFQEAAFKWHLELERCFVVSDKWQDAEAARLSGSTSVLVESSWVGGVHRDFLVPDVTAAARKILQLHQSRHALVA